MPPIHAILFDFMGTCLDWHTTVVSSLPLSIPAATRSALALQWRQTYFNANAARQAAGLPPEDIDITHRRTLLSLLEPDAEFAAWKDVFSEDVIARCIAAWHHQRAWSDVAPALKTLRQQGYEVVVHANGTARLQMNLCKSSGLEFDMLFSSELMGCYKPAPPAYERVLQLLQLTADQVVMVAAHAYDTRGAKDVGIRSVYVQRWSDDIEEDQEIIKGENDRCIEGMSGLVDAIRSLDGNS